MPTSALAHDGTSSAAPPAPPAHRTTLIAAPPASFVLGADDEAKEAVERGHEAEVEAAQSRK